MQRVILELFQPTGNRGKFLAECAGRNVISHHELLSGAEEKVVYLFLSRYFYHFGNKPVSHLVTLLNV